MMNPASRLFVACLLTALAFATGPARAQQPQIRLYEQFNPLGPWSVEEAEIGQQQESAESTEGGELGPQQILVPGPAMHPFLVYSQTDYLFDSNILLLDKDPESDGLLYQTFGISYTARPTDRLTMTLFANYQLIRYTEHDELDFDANNVGFSLSRPIGNFCTMYGGFQASRLYLSDGNDEFYKSFDTTFGLWRGQTVGESGWLYYGYQLDWLPSSPSEFDRVDNAGYVGYKFFPTEKLTVQLLYRIRVDAYLNTDRTDLNNLVSVSANYAFNDFVGIHAYVEYSNNISDASGFDYNVFDSGGGLILQINF